MVLDASLLNTQHYKVRIKGKVEQSREGIAPSPTPWCSSYRKGSLRVTLDYGRQLYFYDTKFSSENSAALSVTMVLCIPFLENIVLNICLTVVAFLVWSGLLGFMAYQPLQVIQTIQAVICNNSVNCKYSFNVEKTVLFQIIQLSIIT